MFDTAGVLLTHRLNALLNESELKAVMPRGRLRPYIPNLLEEVSEGLSPLGTTYLWGAVVRVDVLEAPRATRLSFLGPQSLKVSAMATPAEANQEESSWVYVPEPVRDSTCTDCEFESGRRLQQRGFMPPGYHFIVFYRRFWVPGRGGYGGWV